MSITITSLTYLHPDGETLFENISLSLAKGEKAALVGNNGTGKSTLLQVAAGLRRQSSGEVATSEKPYYVPQHVGQYDGSTLAQALGIAEKVAALHAILRGDSSEQNFACVDEDWGVEDRAQAAMSFWGMSSAGTGYLPLLLQRMQALSGGEKTKVFLAGIQIFSPAIVLLDEPSNHLDIESRRLLYDFIKKSSATMLVVSHDRQLLNLLDTTFELSRRGVETYGGNYDFYAEQKRVESNAISTDIHSKEKALRKAKEAEREAIERRQRAEAQGKKNQEKANLPSILLGGRKNNAERSTARMKGVHAEKVGAIAQKLSDLRKEIPDRDKMKLDFEDSALCHRKVLIAATEVNVAYEGRWLWKRPLTFVITGGERIAITGGNGAGKTTLLKLILGEMAPMQGSIARAGAQHVYIDQDYSLIDNGCTVYELAQRFNELPLPEHEVKIRLDRFLFAKDAWNKPCRALSGGERMRLALCCLNIGRRAPDIVVLDEPTNNLDIQNTEILTAAIGSYRGTLLVVSHDAHFLEQVGIGRQLTVGGE
jgi:ATPase subunit of ABC transporter with duplicated ATPase domains